MSIRMIKTIFAATWLAVASLSFASGDPAEEVRQVVTQNVEEVLAEYETARVYLEEDPERFFTTMDAALTKIVDFRRIAARVMGKHAKRATKAQRGQFTSVFKESLFSAYTKTLASTGSFQIKVNKATLHPRSDKKASVQMDVITSSGTTFPVTYSMYKSKDGSWLMENVIVFGVNVGLAFKDKFAAEMGKNKGNVGKVIENWSVDINLPGAAEEALKSEST